MPAFSFDIISEVDMQEADNAVNQALKEIHTRYDFKGSKSSLELRRGEKKILVVADDELKLRNLHDILKTRMAARNISIKALKFSTPEKAFEGTLRQEIELLCGLTQEAAKIITARVKKDHRDVQPAIQGEKIRVTSKSKDALQGVIQDLRANPPEVALQFTNFK